MDQKIEDLANEIVEFLGKHDMKENIYMMYNNKRVCVETGEITEDEKANEWVEYANNQTITMTFEGEFYRVMNDNWQSEVLQEIEQEFRDLLHKYGYYYELGHAWSLALYDEGGLK